MWSPVRPPSAVTLLHGGSHDLRGFLQELAHEALHEGGTVLWCDGDHGFNPYDAAELNLTRGFQADDGGDRLLVKRCMTPFQWYTTLSRALPEKVEAARPALCIVNPFDRLWSTDELADWEQEDYVRFIVPHLKAIARRHRVPILLGADMARWWRTHPVLAQATHDAVDGRWSVHLEADRLRAVSDTGEVVDPLLRRSVTLLDFMPDEERLPLLTIPRARGAPRRPWRTRIVHPQRELSLSSR